MRDDRFRQDTDRHFLELMDEVTRLGSYSEAASLDIAALAKLVEEFETLSKSKNKLKPFVIHELDELDLDEEVARK